MTKAIPYIMKSSFIILKLDGVTHNIDSTHLNYQSLRDALQAKEWDKVAGLVTVAKAVGTFLHGTDLQLIDETIHYKGEPVNTTLTEIIVSLVRSGKDAKPLTLFLNNVLQNPSEDAVFELYEFAQSGKFTITDDGCILAYKRVRHNFKDIHTGTMDNSPGKTVRMKREDVDANRDNHCSRGLHFCSLSYLSSFASSNPSTDRVVIVKINPRDVVSIPSDYRHTKGRACQYQVIAEHKHGIKDDAFTASVMFLEQDEKTGKSIIVPNQGWKRDVNGKWRDAKGRFLNADQIAEAERNVLEVSVPVANDAHDGIYFDVALNRWRDVETRKFVKAPK
ncbi:hypothetical protein RsoM2USA_38 [Ralstonia phage RsoM2USA]|nr:hypothetical protein RsoM2USA_38 [Ralstonia phage RsoM2USA]